MDIKSLETTTNLTNTIANGQVIGTYTNEDGVSVDIKESVTTLVNNNDGTYSYTSEDGSVSVITDTLGTLICGDKQIAIYLSTNWQCMDYSELNINTFVTNTQLGNLIATYTNEQGDSVDINETITTMTVDVPGQTITYINEKGDTVVADIRLLETTTELIDEGNGNYTYINEDGVKTSFTDSLAQLSCSNSQSIIWSNGGWICGNQASGGEFKITDGTSGQVVQPGDTINFLAGSGLKASVSSVDTVKYELVACKKGQILKFDGANWQCGSDIDTNTDTLASLNCSANQIVRWNGTVWTCSNVADTLSSLNCSNGQIAKFSITSNAWVCGNDSDLLASMNCSIGQFIQFNGTSWVCVNVLPSTPLEYTRAFGKVAANGTGLRVHGATVARLSVGKYRVTLTTPRTTANYTVMLGSLESDSTRDSIGTHVFSQSTGSFDVAISEGDNGAAANTLVDRDWYFEVIDFD